MPDTQKFVRLEIEVFRTGEQTDAGGNTHNWTEEEVKGIEKSYNEAIAKDPSAEAPCVKGHPETDDPAVGWCEGLRMDGGTLKAKVKLLPEFAEEVKKEMYKKISIALRPDMTLRHIGFLGAVHPAVKGMEPVTIPQKEYTAYINSKEFCFADATLLPDEATKTIEHSEFPISLKDNLKREKPSEYKDYTDEDFADPVHFRFPIKTYSEVSASMASFSRDDVRREYSEKEQLLLAARILFAARKHGFKNNPEKWDYNELVQLAFGNIEMPIGLLTKKQLEDYVNRHLANTNSNTVSNYGDTMNEEWFNGLLSFIAEKAKAELGDEAATKITGWAQEYKTANPLQQQTTDNTSGTTAAEHSETAKEKEYRERYEKQQAKIEALEKINRTNAFSAYLDKHAEQVPPAQKEKYLAMLEFAHQHSNVSFEFSENGKKVKSNGKELLKSIIESLPKQVEFSEQAVNGQPEDLGFQFSTAKGGKIDSDRAKLFIAANKFMEEQRQKGKEINLETAALMLCEK